MPPSREGHSKVVVLGSAGALERGGQSRFTLESPLGLSEGLTFSPKDGRIPLDKEGLSDHKKDTEGVGATTKSKSVGERQAKMCVFWASQKGHFRHLPPQVQ